jgi:hypothetical protein
MYSGKSIAVAVLLTAVVLSLSCSPRVSPIIENTLSFDPRGLISLNDPQVQASLKTILDGKDDVRTDFRRIQDWVAANVVYDSDIGGYWQWPSETLSKRKGDCKDYSTLLCTLWRAAGVPAADVYVAIGQARDSSRHAFIIQKYIGSKWQVIEPQVGGFILSDLSAVDTAEKYAITFLFNDVQYVTGPSEISSMIRGGVTITSQPRVKPPPPVVNAFTVDRKSMPSGESAVLSWDVSGATYVGIDQGIGGVDTIGTVYVSPAETTEYRLAAMNETGSATASVTVKVMAVAYPRPPSQTIPFVEDKQSPFIMGFAGWYSGKEEVTQVNVGQQVAARINLKGGNAGPYFLRVWRAMNTGHDEIVMQSAFSYDGAGGSQEITFSPSYVLGEAGTRGYWVDLQSGGGQVWAMPNSYPPRLIAAPRPQTGPLSIGFAGWYTGGDSISSIKKGLEVTGAITLAGGSAGSYSLRAERDAAGLNDEMVKEINFDYDGTSAIQQIKFTPQYGLDESSTRGYYLDLYKDGKYLWSLGGNYPPKLQVTR